MEENNNNIEIKSKKSSKSKSKKGESNKGLAKPKIVNENNNLVDDSKGKEKSSN